MLSPMDLRDTPNGSKRRQEPMSEPPDDPESIIAAAIERYARSDLAALARAI
jgi:hypothetical protein